MIPEKSARTVAEIVTFRLADGVGDDQFVKAAETTVAFLEADEGFLRRRLSKNADGSWTDYVEWTDMEAATAAGQRIMADPAVMPFMQAIEEGSVTMRHEHILWTMR